jgi:hypothetical protein
MDTNPATLVANDGEHLSEASLNENAIFNALSPENSAEGDDEGELHIDLTSEKNVVIEKVDRSLYEFHRWYQQKKLIIDPEWQRSYVWDKKRASRLIESFLIDLPVPVIYLAKTNENKYEVIDGVQRLTSVFEFFAGKFSLIGLELLPDLNKKTFSELPEALQHKLEDTTLRSFDLSSHTSSNFLFVIFERLNTGGVPLNEMEVRNCVYRGSLNNLIRELAKNSDFVQAVNQKDLAKRMADRALILRFLAFYERHYTKATNGLKAFLNQFFEIYKNPNEEKLREFEKQFKKAMKASVTVFGQNAFRLRRVDVKGGGEWTPRTNAPIFQAISVSFTEYDLTQITERSDAILEAFVDLVTTDKKFIDCVSKSTGDAPNIRYVFETWNARLKEVMDGSQPLDKTRIFSKKLKLEMFESSNTCAICNQEIKTLHDAALDHERHYWRGGQTIPSNARLVHRHCNLTREH